MKSQVSIKGHPIHPILVSLPIGLLFFSFVCDMISLFTDQSVLWSRLAFVSMSAGVVGAVIAAIPGFIDFLSIRGGNTLGIARNHLAANFVVIFLYALNIVIRSILPLTSVIPVLLSTLGVLLLVYSGWLGGEMIYRYGMGVDTNNRESGSEKRQDD